STLAKVWLDFTNRLLVMAASLSSERHDVHARRSSRTSFESPVENTTAAMDLSSLNVDDLVQGTGQWQNMQEIIRSAIKALLDTQAEQQQRMAAQEKTLRDVRGLLLVGSRKPPASDSGCREMGVRATAAAAAAAAAAETAAGLSKLREDVSIAREDARAESNDLLARVESRASKEHVKACLGGKADQGELAELRSCVDRLSKEAGVANAREVQTLRNRALALERRVVEIETRVRGCEAHAVRADPAAFALRIETVSSGLDNLRKRVDHKASASATERALEHKADKSMLGAALESKADRADLSAIESSVASLLIVSRERAATATATATATAAALERNNVAVAAAAAAATAAVAETSSHSAAAAAAADAAAPLRLRADGHDQALGRLSAAVAAVKDKLDITA
ncbi:unnamed protein product, partial [Pylaiella littoralis]